MPLVGDIWHRRDVAEFLMHSKNQKQVTFDYIANCVGRSEFWTCAALLGQTCCDAQEAEALLKCLEVDPKLFDTIKAVLMEPPMRGCIPNRIPTDPTIYRFYEIIQVYGTTFKALLAEKLGDGMISVANMTVRVDRERRGERDFMKVTLCSKFKPYKKW